MTGDRELIAESLSDILQYTREGNKSGIVSIEYLLGGVVEEGEIHFRAGRPIYARVGSLYNQEALDVVSNWRRIYFRFMRNSAPMLQITPSDAGSRSARALPSHVPATPFPSSPNPITGGFQMSPNPTTGGFHKERTTDPLSMSQRSYDPTQATLMPDIKPQKLSVKQDVLTLPLSRRQRLIYMLIDGRRTIADLAKMTRKNFQDVERILIELQEQRLVSL